MKKKLDKPNTTSKKMVIEVHIFSLVFEQTNGHGYKL